MLITFIRSLALILTPISLFLLNPASAANIQLDSSLQLFIVGKIVPGDYDKFERALRESTEDINAVNIISPGGNIFEAFKIGRLIRRLGLATNAPNTLNFAPQARTWLCSRAAKIDKSTACTCASACFLIWAGGVERSGNDIHIHRISFDPEYYGKLTPIEAQEKYQMALRQVQAYLKEMEIPDSIFEEMVRMPSYSTTPLPNNINWAWPPSFGEWLTAKCGHPSRRRDSMCEMEQRRKATKEALDRFRAVK